MIHSWRNLRLCSSSFDLAIIFRPKIFVPDQKAWAIWGLALVDISESSLVVSIAMPVRTDRVLHHQESSFQRGRNKDFRISVFGPQLLAASFIRIVAWSEEIFSEVGIVRGFVDVDREEERFCKAGGYLLEIWLSVVINRPSAGILRFTIQPGFCISVPVPP